MADHVQQTSVGAVDVLEFQVQHRIDPMLARQQSKAILPAITCEEAALAKSSLPIQVEFGGPPTLYSVLEFGGAAHESVAIARLARHVLGGELEIARLFHLVRISDKEWAFAPQTGGR